MDCSLLSGDGRVVLRCSALWFQVNIILQKTHTHSLINIYVLTPACLYCIYIYNCMFCFDFAGFQSCLLFLLPSICQYTLNTFVVAVIASVVYNIIISFTVTIMTTKASEQRRFSQGNTVVKNEGQSVICSTLTFFVQTYTYVHMPLCTTAASTLMTKIISNGFIFRFLFGSWLPYIVVCFVAL